MRYPRLFVVALLCASHAALAQGVHNNHLLRLTHEHGLTFSEIGDVGNPGFGWDAPGPAPKVVIGGVDYRYRIATTEVTHAQWFVFLNALALISMLRRFAQRQATHWGRRGYLGRGPDGVPGYRLVPQVRQRPAEMGWRFAAIYTNWLHNGAPAQNAAYEVFANGAYDASTFTTNPDGTRNDQMTHNPDARFWIPTRDEWHKAGYWAPNRYGEGEGGWWLYPNGTDERMVVGTPDEGANTNFGARFSERPDLPLDVGSYPEQLSPWGLLDVSGGMSEWTEDVAFEPTKLRHVAGTRVYQIEGQWTYGDHLGWNFHQGASPVFPNGGLRIAAAIPSPGAFPVFACAITVAARRRR